MNKQIDSNQTESKTELHTVLPAVFIVKTRYEAHDKMKLGEEFKALSQLSKYNKSMIDFWADKYNYIKEKSTSGYHIYKPAYKTSSTF
jgi:hypothetical protein